MITVSGLSKGYEGRVLFRDLSFGLATTDRLGIVGANGSGKSTLLKVLAGLQPADTGRVTRASGARIGYLPQNPVFDPTATVLALASVADDHEVAEHQVWAVLDRLGFSSPDTTTAGELSGGQRRRVALAKALVAPSDVLILDEPTNHLDADTVEWLEQHLRRRPGGLVLVTHDRYLLERITTEMLELDRSGAFWHDGSYSALLEAKAARSQATDAAEARRQNLLRKEIAWLRRGAQARSTKPKFRVDQAQALMANSPDKAQAPLQLGTGRRRLGNDVVELMGVTVTYGTGSSARTVLRNVDMLVGPGDRIGVVGPNGAGKTTLLNVLTGRLAPTAGTVRIGTTVEWGLYDQELTVEPVSKRAIDAVIEIARTVPLADGTTVPATTICERFGFDNRLQGSSIALLSGGERRRLALLQVLIGAPNVLVLDEPTNDLDVDTLSALEDHLDGFAGTLLVASHDRFVLDRLCDTFYGVEPDGRVVKYPGDWASYRELTAARGGATGAAKPNAVSAPQAVPATNTKPAKSANPAKPSASSGGRELRDLETRIAKLTKQRDQLAARLESVGADHEAMTRLGREIHTVIESLTAAEDHWLHLADG